MRESHTSAASCGAAERCPACGWFPLERVRVHGHAQCARCHTNIEPCCQPDPPTRTPAGAGESLAQSGERQAQSG